MLPRVTEKQILLDWISTMYFNPNKALGSWTADSDLCNDWKGVECYETNQWPYDDDAVGHIYSMYDPVFLPA